MATTTAPAFALSPCGESALRTVPQVRHKGGNVTTWPEVTEAAKALAAADFDKVRELVRDSSHDVGWSLFDRGTSVELALTCDHMVIGSVLLPRGDYWEGMGANAAAAKLLD